MEGEPGDFGGLWEKARKAGKVSQTIDCGIPGMVYL
jgi:hypothetical protein